MKMEAVKKMEAENDYVDYTDNTPAQEIVDDVEVDSLCRFEEPVFEAPVFEAPDLDLELDDRFF